MNTTLLRDRRLIKVHCDISERNSVAWARVDDYWAVRQAAAIADAAQGLPLDWAREDERVEVRHVAIMADCIARHSVAWALNDKSIVIQSLACAFHGSYSPTQEAKS